MVSFPLQRAGYGFRITEAGDFRLSGCIAVFLLCCLTGCTTLSSIKPWEGREHVEEVFRHQNQVSGRLLMLLIDHNNDERLLQAERRLLDACEPLNNMAIRQIKDQSTNIITRFKTRFSVNECDHVARDVEQMLESYRM